MTPFVPKGSIYRDGADKLKLESRNGVIQAEYILYTALHWDAESRFSSELVKELQRLAVNQIYRCAGHFRDGAVSLEGGTHEPPPFDQVPRLVDDMCAYVNDHWSAAAIHLASYLMWRTNWIHPFYGGNGRSARSLSYLALCAKLGFVLPGTRTIPELIQENRDPYYAALRACDAAWAQGSLDLSPMEELLSSLLAKQLVELHQKATGRTTG